MREVIAAALLFASCAGCGAGERSTEPGGFRTTLRLDPVVTGSIATAAEQVRRCYRAPRVAHDALQIATRLHVRFAPDGTLAALPAIVAQSGVTPANQVYAAPMGEAAVLSVIHCAPLKLPAEAYAAGWQEFDLTFSPKMSV